MGRAALVAIFPVTARLQAWDVRAAVVGRGTRTRPTMCHLHLHARGNISTLARMTGVADEHCDLLCLSLPRAEQLRSGRLGTAAVSQVAARARALSDPTRLTIAAVLAEGGELCVCDLAWICERSQNLVSHHLRNLRAGGLVTSRRDKKMVMYSLTPQGSALVELVLAMREVVAR